MKTFDDNVVKSLILDLTHDVSWFSDFGKTIMSKRVQAIDERLMSLGVTQENVLHYEIQVQFNAWIDKDFWDLYTVYKINKKSKYMIWKRLFTYQINVNG